MYTLGQLPQLHSWAVFARAILNASKHQIKISLQDWSLEQNKQGFSYIKYQFPRIIQGGDLHESTSQKKWHSQKSLKRDKLFLSVGIRAKPTSHILEPLVPTAQNILVRSW